MADQKFKSKVRLEGGANLPAQTASTVPVINGSNDLVSSSVTTTELGYVSGVTSSIQTQLGNKIESSEKGSNNGVATLDAGGKIPASQLPNSVMEYKGNWNASTNSPTLADGAGNAGDVYRVSVAGSQDLGSGSISFAVGDWAVYNGSIWEKSLNSNSVVSVNSQTGIVVLDTDDIAEGANLYFTDERVDDRVAALVVAGAGITSTYDDGAGTLTIASTITQYTDELAQDAVGAMIATTDTVTLTYTDGTPELKADVKTQMSITSDASGIKLVGDASTPGNTRYYGTDGSGTKGFFAIPNSGASAGDIVETSFSAANNQAAAASVTGLAFAAATVRGFKALVSVAIDATADLYETFELVGINKAGSFDMAVSSVGDSSGIVFSITSAGQVQYTSTNLAGFVDNTIKFRAYTTTV